MDIRGPNVKNCKEGEMPYLVSLSKLMRLAFINTSANELDSMGKSIAETFENDLSLKENLQSRPNEMRQIDIKNDKNKVIFKTFVSWNVNECCWHVFMELPNENVWENGDGNV